MSVLEVAFRQRTNNVVVLQTFLSGDLRPGDTITVASVGEGMDGVFTVRSVQPYELVRVDDAGNLVFDYSEIRVNQIIYDDTGSDVGREAVTDGTVTYTESVSWINSGDVLVWLGVEPANQNDVDYLEMCTNASNAFCYRKRREAGYADQMSVAPSPDVKQGALVYAAILYRERGAVDGFASFDGFGGGAPTMSLSRVMQLLGCGRPQVG